MGGGRIGAVQGKFAPSKYKAKSCGALGRGVSCDKPGCETRRAWVASYVGSYSGVEKLWGGFLISPTDSGGIWRFKPPVHMASPPTHLR